VRRSVEQIARSVDKGAAGIGVMAAFVLQVLASHADAEGYCYPSQALLVQETGISDRAIRNALADLRRLGIVEVVRGRVHHTPNRYRVRVDLLAAMPRVGRKETGTTCRTDEALRPARDAALSTAPHAALASGDRQDVPARPAPHAGGDRHHVPLEDPKEDPKKNHLSLSAGAEEKEGRGSPEEAKRPGGKTCVPERDSPELPSWLDRHGIPRAGEMVQDFLDHARETGRKSADWGSAWSRWKREGKRRGIEAEPPKPPEYPKPPEPDPNAISFAEWSASNPEGAQSLSRNLGSLGVSGLVPGAGPAKANGKTGTEETGP
jgi:hypothetical protein